MVTDDKTILEDENTEAKKSSVKRNLGKKAKIDEELDSAKEASIDLEQQIQVTKQVSPELMTFLLYMIHSHLERGGSYQLLPLCPVDVGFDLATIVSEIPNLTSTKQISELPKDQKRILNWAAETIRQSLDACDRRFGGSRH